jgi:hypothetical protein
MDFEVPGTADELRQQYAALTIQTTPEQAQAVIDYCKRLPATGETDWWKLLGPNCTTVCRDALKAGRVIPRDLGSIAPEELWDALYRAYGDPSKITYHSVSNRDGDHWQFPIYPHQQGTGYGRPRYGINPFVFILQSCTVTTATWYENGKYAGTTTSTNCGN